MKDEDKDKKVEYLPAMDYEEACRISDGDPDILKLLMPSEEDRLRKEIRDLKIEKELLKSTNNNPMYKALMEHGVLPGKMLADRLKSGKFSEEFFLTVMKSIMVKDVSTTTKNLHQITIKRKRF